MNTPATSTPTYNALIRQLKMPARIRVLPVSENGYPIPYFVKNVDGKYDFRIMDMQKLYSCFHLKKCWTCGQPLGRNRALVLGPMCTINRIVSEPPSHLDCAVFSATACPFLSNPRMRRNEKGLPEERELPPGYHSEANPTVCAVWVTDDVRMERVGKGVLFEFGDPSSVLWFAEGKPASRDVIETGFKRGAEKLREMAMSEGPNAVHAAELSIAVAETLLPKPAEATAA